MDWLLWSKRVCSLRNTIQCYEVDVKGIKIFLGSLGCYNKKETYRTRLYLSELLYCGLKSHSTIIVQLFLRSIALEQCWQKMKLTMLWQACHGDYGER